MGLGSEWLPVVGVASCGVGLVVASCGRSGFLWGWGRSGFSASRNTRLRLAMGRFQSVQRNSIVTAGFNVYDKVLSLALEHLVGSIVWLL